VRWLCFNVGTMGLPLATAHEQGRVFSTCMPVTFRYVRNTEKSPDFGSKYQQDIEPAGRYLLHNEDPGDVPSKWESGLVTLQCPLVLLFNTHYPDEIYGPHSWKAALTDHYGVRGAALSRKLRASGFDGIITVIDPDETREIVVL